MQFQESQNRQVEQESESFEQTCIFCHSIPQEIISLTCKHDFCLNCALKEVPNSDGEIPQNFFCKFCKKPTHLSEDLRQILIMLQKKNTKRISTELPSREDKFKPNILKFGKLEQIFEVDSSSQQYDSHQSLSGEELKQTPNFKMEFNKNSEIQKKVILNPYVSNEYTDFPKCQKFLRQSDLFYKKSTNTNQTEDNPNFDKDLKPQTILEGLELSNDVIQQNNIQQNLQQDEESSQKSDQIKKYKTKKNAKIDIQKLLQSLELKTKKGKSLQKTKHKNSSSKNKSQKKFFLSSKNKSVKKTSFRKSDICKIHQQEYQVILNDQKVCVKCHEIQKKKIETQSKRLRINVPKDVEQEFSYKKKLLKSLLNNSVLLQESFSQKIDNMKKKGLLFYEQIKLSLDKEYKHFQDEVSILERKFELNFEEYKMDISDMLSNCKKYMQNMQKSKPVDYYLEKKSKFEKSLQEENKEYGNFFEEQKENLAQFFRDKYFNYGQSILKKFEQSSLQLFRIHFSLKIHKEDIKTIKHYFGLDSSQINDKILQIKEIGYQLNDLKYSNQKLRNSIKSKQHRKKSTSNKKTTTRKSFKKFSRNHKSQKQF